MGLFKAEKRLKTKSTRITDYNSTYNDFIDKVSYHKVYQNYYPERNYRSDILGMRVSDCIDIDSYTTNSELVREGRNRYHTFYNKKFTRIKRHNNLMSFKEFRLIHYYAEDFDNFSYNYKF